MLFDDFVGPIGLGPSPTTDDEEMRRAAMEHMSRLAGASPGMLDTFNQWSNRSVTPQMVQDQWAVAAPTRDVPPSPVSAPQLGGGGLDDLYAGKPRSNWYSPQDFASIIGGGHPPAPTSGGSYIPSGGGDNRYASLPVLDNYIPRDPIHILGVNGFRTGSSAPMVDYSGPLARAQADRTTTNMLDLFNRQDVAAGDQATKMAMFMGTMGNKNQQAKDRSLMLIGNAKVPSTVARSEIDDMVKRGEIDKSQADMMMLERNLSVPDQHGQLQPIGPDQKTGSMLNVLSRVPSDADPDLVRKFLMENRGITRDQVVKRHKQLLESGMPWVDPGNIMAGRNTNPDTFDKNKLTAEQRAEFDAITRIFGNK